MKKLLLHTIAATPAEADPFRTPDYHEYWRRDQMTAEAQATYHLLLALSYVAGVGTPLGQKAGRVARRAGERALRRMQWAQEAAPSRKRQAA